MPLQAITDPLLNAGWNCRQYTVHHSMSTCFHVHHMSSVWACSRLWKEQWSDLAVLVFSGEYQLSCTVSHTRTPDRHGIYTNNVSDCFVTEVHMSSPECFVGLWQCSSCSSSHKRVHTSPAAGLMTFYCLGHSLLWSPSGDCVWKTQQAFLWLHVGMWHSGLHVQFARIARTISCHQYWQKQ